MHSQSSASVTLVGVLIGPLLSVLCLGAMIVSSHVIVRSVVDANLIDYAKALELGAKRNLEELKRFIFEPNGPTFGLKCGDLASRARLTLNLALRETAVQRGEIEAILWGLHAAETAAISRLSCSPLDGNAWLQLARVKGDLIGPGPEALEALRVSAVSAPAEEWILEPRLDIEAAWEGAFPATYEAQYLSDLRRFVDWEGGDRIASAYVNHDGKVQRGMRRFMDQLAEDRKKAIFLAIDHLGVDYSRP